MNLVKLTEKEFEDFALNCDQATFLQTICWANLKKQNGWSHEILGFKSKKKVIAATILLSKQTPVKKKMFYAPRGFLLDYTDEKLFENFTLKIKEYVKNNDGIFFKIDPYIMRVQRNNDGEIVEEGINNFKVVEKIKELGFKEKCAKPGQQTLQAKWMHRLNLKDKTIDDIIKDMSTKTKRMIRKNEKSGVVLREGSYEELVEFKNIMDHTGERRQFISRSLKYLQDMYKSFGNGKYLKLYFVELDINKAIEPLKDEFEQLELSYNQVISSIENGGTKIHESTLQAKKDELDRVKSKIEQYNQLSEKHGNKIVLGGALFFTLGKEVLAFIGGAYEEFMEFQSFYTLNYEMIKYAIDNKYEYYNFYAISSDLTPKDPMYGIYLFKKGFGGEVVELIGEYDYPVRKCYYLLYDVSYKIVHTLKKIKTKLHI